MNIFARAKRNAYFFKINATSKYQDYFCKEFVAMMNAKCKELGMNNSRFVNPDGCFTGNYSTVEDLMLLLKEALKNDLIKETWSQREGIVEISGDQKTVSAQMLEEADNDMPKYKIVGGKSGTWLWNNKYHKALIAECEISDEKKSTSLNGNMRQILGRKHFQGLKRIIVLY